jgi:thiosulfate/3-mercaptopyruvate sulfurtransferase
MVAVTAEWLSEQRVGDEVVLVDARSPEAYRVGHIPFAISIPPDFLPMPHAPSEIDALAAALGEHGLTGGEHVVCCGDDATDAEAGRLFWLLDVAGAERVSMLDGGFVSWTAEERPVSVAGRERQGVSWEREPRPERLATLEYVEAHFGEPGHEIIDTRERDEWEGLPGAEGDPSVRVGHIPHSLAFDFREFLGDDGNLRDQTETRSIFSGFGPRPSTPVDLTWEFIVHGEGATDDGALGYYLLRRAGVESLRFYPGGWTEWLRHPGLPVVRFIGAEEIFARLQAEGRPAGSDELTSTFVLIDVRHFSSFGHSHIPGALNLYSDGVAESLEVYVEHFWPDFDRENDPVVTYCYGSNCIRSRNSATQAARLGFLNVERFYGGTEDWEEIEGPLASGRRPALGAP